jgi:hypothetical protein
VVARSKGVEVNDEVAPVPLVPLDDPLLDDVVPRVLDEEPDELLPED